MTGYDWKSATVIERDELEEYLYEVGTEEDQNLHVKSYFIKLRRSGVDWDGFARLLRHRFVDYVFSQEELTEYQERGEQAHPEAEDRAGFDADYKRDGTLGEFLLFLLADGFHDLPMISHKVATGQSFSHEVFGCDNVYFGTFNDEECLGIGEAKVHRSLSGAIADAFTSISEFHEESSRIKFDQELNVAPRRLSSNLGPSEIEHLANLLSGRSSDYAILHPILICHQTSRLSSVEDVTKEIEEIEGEIGQILERQGYLTKCKEKLSAETSRLRRAYLLFFFLPVPDIDEFRYRMISAISPGMRVVMDLDRGK